MMKQMMEMNIHGTVHTVHVTWLNIPTSGRQTSWLFKSMIQGVERGFTEKQLQVLSTQNSHEAESITALML